jgi:hypothetical protein
LRVRSVFVFTTVDRPSLEKTLDLLGERQTDQWVLWEVLDVRIDEPPDWADGLEPHRQQAIASAMGGVPPRVVVADISGRVPGLGEARRLAHAVLELGKGVALDDYSDHAWSIAEIDELVAIEDRHFFEPLARNEHSASGPTVSQ